MLWSVGVLNMVMEELTRYKSQLLHFTVQKTFRFQMNFEQTPASHKNISTKFEDIICVISNLTVTSIAYFSSDCTMTKHTVNLFQHH